MWVIYTQSHSALQTSLIQVVWHLDRIIFSPLAGIFADRWDRKRIMVLANVLSAAVVGALAIVMLARGQAPSAANLRGRVPAQQPEHHLGPGTGLAHAGGRRA